MPWQVPGYRQREDLAGGTGRVVLAVDESTGQLVVIKYLNAVSSDTSTELRSAIDDISGLPNDYFVRIQELVQDSGHNAIVMDRLTGTTMRALIRDDGPFGPESALSVFRDTLTGLTYAHALDIVHGGVSPENAMVGPDGRPVLLNVGAVIWEPREPTLSSGVYLAPERWDGGPPAAAADVYAATVAFVESLVGEPPYWEDTDLDRLRRRHIAEEVDVTHIPAALHDVVRAGLAKSADERLTSAALLDLVETAAIAGYGRDWANRGRDGVAQRVRSGPLPSGDRSAVASEVGVRDTEDVANDDYYADPQISDKSSNQPAGDAAAEAVMAAAAEIVAFAQLRDSAEADAILAASTDEELTEEEESAVAEIERLLFPDEQHPEVPTGSAEVVDPAPPDRDPALAETTVTPTSAVPVPAGASSGSGGGRRPWWLALGAVAAVLVVAGLLTWAGVGRSGPSAHPAAASSGRPIATTPPPAASAPGTTGSGGTGSSAPPSAGASGASGASGAASAGAPSNGAPSAGPTLPLTGFEHPIRLMAAVSAGFVLVGGFLLYAGRRRDEAAA